MNIISIKEFYERYKNAGRILPIERIFDEFCSEVAGRKIINFCLVYEGDDKLDFINHIARINRDVVSIATFDSRSLKIEGDEAVYSPKPEIKGRCIALLSDDELLRMLSKAV